MMMVKKTQGHTIICPSVGNLHVFNYLGMNWCLVVGVMKAVVSDLRDHVSFGVVST